jgi:hypothetical protein
VGGGGWGMFLWGGGPAPPAQIYFVKPS